MQVAQRGLGQVLHICLLHLPSLHKHGAHVT